jgi:hypothetical protein
VTSERDVEQVGCEAERRVGAAATFPKVAVIDPATECNQKYLHMSSIFICQARERVRRSAHVSELVVVSTSSHDADGVRSPPQSVVLEWSRD